MYLKGIGTKADADQAVTWLTKAGTNGHPAAQFILGTWYYNGTHVSKDLSTAFLWYTKAANQSNPNAEYNLGLMYENGEGTAKSIPDALKWLEKAATDKIPEAAYTLGMLYEKGEIVPQDYTKALKWYQQSSDYSQSQQGLGQLYFNGYGVTSDHAAAFQWFLKAAKQGISNSQGLVGSMFYMGDGVGKDTKQAEYWLGLAASHGDQKARQILPLLKLQNGIEDPQKQTSEPPPSIAASEGIHAPNPPLDDLKVIKTKDGKEYKNPKMVKFDNDGVEILCDDGGATIPYSNLPTDIQGRFGYSTQAKQVPTQSAPAPQPFEKDGMLGGYTLKYDYTLKRDFGSDAGGVTDWDAGGVVNLKATLTSVSLFYHNNASPENQNPDYPSPAQGREIGASSPACRLEPYRYCGSSRLAGRCQANLSHHVAR
jgi:TPR repeat protein